MIDLAAIAARVAASAIAASGETGLWRAPIVGAVSASRVVAARLREIASPTHLLPSDLLVGARSVVCFFVPFAKEVSDGNSSGDDASAGWGRAYVRTNRLIAEIGEGIAASLASLGYRAATVPATHNFDEETLLSDWSHRHLAYLAGIGSFGLNNMLITDSGAAGRLGSAVTDVPLAGPAPAPARERCLAKLDGSCRACIARCPVGALSHGTFNRRACYDVCLRNARRLTDVGYADVCGKCVVALPCSLRDPTRGRSGPAA